MGVKRELNGKVVTQSTREQHKKHRFFTDKERTGQNNTEQYRTIQSPTINTPRQHTDTEQNRTTTVKTYLEILGIICSPSRGKILFLPNPTKTPIISKARAEFLP